MEFYHDDNNQNNDQNIKNQNQLNQPQKPNLEVQPIDQIINSSNNPQFPINKIDKSSPQKSEQIQQSPQNIEIKITDLSDNKQQFNERQQQILQQNREKLRQLEEIQKNNQSNQSLNESQQNPLNKNGKVTWQDKNQIYLPPDNNIKKEINEAFSSRNLQNSQQKSHLQYPALQFNNQLSHQIGSFNPSLGMSYANPFAFMQQMRQSQYTQFDHDFQEDTDYLHKIFFLCCFKIMIVFSYIILPMVFSKMQNVYQSIVLYAIMDFWIVKNISGRQMLGMRWWIEIDSTGEQRWVFESKTNLNHNSSKQFWGISGIFSICWILLSLISLIQFNVQMSISFFVAFLQASFNLWVYRQCVKARNYKMKYFLQKLGTNENMMKSVKLTFDLQTKQAEKKE